LLNAGRMRNQTFFLVLVATLAACRDKQAAPKGSPDWGDDPRPLGACVGNVKGAAELPDGAVKTFCLEKQTRAECEGPSSDIDYTYAHHTTCASRGFAKQCEGGGFPASARFEECPGNTREPGAAVDARAAAGEPAASAADHEAAKQVVAMFHEATQAADGAKGDCKAFGAKLAPIRDRLWDVGKAHPSVLRKLSDPELRAIRAADAMDALTDRLTACKDNVNAKEFVFAIGKVM
jgi:hypothetical protein